MYFLNDRAVMHQSLCACRRFLAALAVLSGVGVTATAAQGEEGNPYAQAVLADNPVGYWRFEEPSGAESAASSAAGDAQLSGIYHEVVLEQPTATPILGRSALFSGDEDEPSFVDFGNPEALKIAGNLTIEWWQYVDYTDTEARSVICWANPGEGREDNVLYEMMLRFSKADKEAKYPRARFTLGHEYGEGENIRLRSWASAQPFRWYYIVAVRDAEERTVQYYVNGLPSGERIDYSDNAQGGGNGGAAVGKLGRFDRRYFKGRLDEIAIYNHCLSGEQVLAHFRAALGKDNPADRMEVVGHRGNKRFAPENTMVSYTQAIDVGTDILEMDLRLTKDQQVVLLHDDTVDRTTNGTGNIADMTLAQAAALDAGSWKESKYKGERIPTLESIAQMCKPRGAVMMLDLKSAGQGEQIAAVLAKTGFDMDRVVVAPWKTDQAEDIRKHLPDPMMVLLHSKPPKQFGSDHFDAMEAMGFRGYSLKWMHLLEPFVDAAHARGMKVYTWTVNDPDEIGGAVLMGLDGVITDDPAGVQKMLEKLGTQ